MSHNLRKIMNGKYAVSENGEVYSLWFVNKQVNKPRATPLLLRPSMRSGYLRVTLCCDGTRKDFSVHSLVLETFIGARPQGMIAGHKNGVPTDNRASNLSWITPKQNQVDRFRHGTHDLGERNHNAMLTEEKVRDIRRFSSSGMKQIDICKKFGIHRDTARKIVKGERWPHVAELEKGKK